jgi:hypothetical protein
MIKKLKTRNAIKTIDKKFYIENEFKKDLYSTSLSTNFSSAQEHDKNLEYAIKENNLLENAEFSFGPQKLIAKYDRIDVIQGSRRNYLELVNAASQDTLKEWIHLYSSFVKLPEAVSTMCMLFDEIYEHYEESNNSDFILSFLKKKHTTVHEISFSSLFKFNFKENKLYKHQDSIFEHRKEQLLMHISFMCQLSDEIKMPSSYTSWYYNHGDNIFTVADILVRHLTKIYNENKLTDQQIKVLEYEQS